MSTEFEMKNLSTVQALLIVSEIGISFAAAVVAGLLLGGWIDSVLHTSPVFVIIGALAGTGAGISGAVQLARLANKKREQD